MEEQLATQLKQQLRDIHLPEEVSWWPLAYGWWILLVLSAVGITVLIYYFLRKRKQNAYRYAAIKELSQIYSVWQEQNDVASYLQSANAILKRSVLYFTKQHDAAGQTGQAWLSTLARSASGELSIELRQALGVQVYRANAQADVNLVHDELCHWLRTHRTKPRLTVEDSNQNSNLAISESKNSKLEHSEARDA